MIKRPYLILIALVLSAVLLAGCGQRTNPEPTDKLRVTVSILPQKYFVERVGGEHVDVNVMVAPGDSPHTYEPKPEQLRALSQATVYFSIGVEFEKAWMDRIASANSEMLIVDTTEDIERMPMAASHHEEEEHGQEGENLDPHIWTSPNLVKIQAKTIYSALVTVDPDHQADYQANLDEFISDINELDADIRETLAGLETQKFMVFHPSWGYFARDYGLEMIPIEIGGTEPSAAELAALIAEAKEENIRVIFAQPEFSTRDADTIANEIGGKVLLISPLAPDWLDNLHQVADTFAEVLGQ
ncbi:MAG: zinc ABC transporter substrate-binding protein [Chloroflexota bacterium]|nr:zinc ABC transporter substrate-binding protein [Chloroflexota bacterium]